MIRKRSSLILPLVIAILALSCAIAMGHFYQRHTAKTSTPGPSDEIVSIISTDQYSYSTINELCDAPGARIEEKEVEVKFLPPAPRESRTTKCPWGVGDNLTPRPRTLASRYEQLFAVQLPPKASLCGLDVKVRATPFERQDYFFLNLNSRILVTDAEFVFKYLQEETVTLSQGEKISSYLYDWSRIMGVRIPKNLTEANRREYCVGRDISLANCEFGNGEAPRLEVHNKIARWLGSKNLGPTLRFGLVVTGDNDLNEDCSSSQLAMDIKMKYVLPKDAQ